MLVYIQLRLSKTLIQNNGSRVRGTRLVMSLQCYGAMNFYLALTCPALSMLASKR